MKPKTTLNLSNDCYPNAIQKLILLFLNNFDRKASIATYNFVLVFVFMFITLQSFSQSSKATLQVEKNRFTQSVPPEGTIYNLQISNLGTATSNYTLSVSNVNNGCSNNDGSSSSSNVNLAFSFTDINQNSISEISLSPGETATFFTIVKVPIGTSYNKWNCTEIIATSKEYPSYKVSTVLHTLVSDPNQE
ncbi:hypothetical protein [Flavobacterium sp. IMCC34518]|uniref:hypothetical protein n=1 Tax=Flavobacterium sp. IMCC34518 TaxID=3003623 RepID=UPI0022AC2A90|nr:hypothetical protein [Flavobacterium sp. IMCC34518]